MFPVGAVDSKYLYFGHWSSGGLQMSQVILELFTNISEASAGVQSDNEQYSSKESWRVLFQNTISTNLSQKISFVEESRIFLSL